MKVGDLVKIAPHCKNKHRMAIVVRTEDWERNGVWITFLDGKGNGEPRYDFQMDGVSYAMISNLVLLSEGSKKS